MRLHSEALVHAYSAGLRGLIHVWLSWSVWSTLVAFFLQALLFQGTPMCGVVPISKAMSSEVLCAWSWACRADGRRWSLTGRLLALGIWGCALGQDIGTQAPSSVFCFHEMSGLPCCLLPAIWPCHTEAWWQQREATTDGNLWNP